MDSIDFEGIRKILYSNDEEDGHNLKKSIGNESRKSKKSISDLEVAISKVEKERSFYRREREKIGAGEREKVELLRAISNKKSIEDILLIAIKSIASLTTDENYITQATNLLESNGYYKSTN